MKQLLVMTFLAAVSLAFSATSDGALLPPDAFAQGWSKDGSAKVYEGEALYDHIDGGGEVFLELGFEACSVQRYRRGPAQFTIELYRMKDAAAALGIYLMNCGRETPEKAFLERHTVGRNQLLAQKGRYYLVATSPEAEPGMAQILVAAAKAVTGQIPKAGPIAFLGLLPKEGLLSGSERIVRGSIGLQSIVTLGEGDVLLLDRKATAVAADYKDKGGATHSLLIAEYASPQAAAESLRHLIAQLDPQFSILSAGDRDLVFKDRKGHFGQAALEGAQLTIRLDLAKKPG
jgi:hypothetical protein